MRILLPLSLAMASALCLPAQADDNNTTVYYWTDASGGIHYSDHPVAGKTTHEMQVEIANPPSSNVNASTQSAPISGTTSDQSTTTAINPDNTNYSIQITAPTEGETIRDNAGNLTVQAEVTPQLVTAPDMPLLQLQIDSQMYQCDTSTSACSATNLDRGEHQIKVLLSTKDGKQIASSDVIKVYLFRTSTIQRKSSTN